MEHDYQTKDLSLASALHSCGFKYTGFEKTTKGTVRFYFERSYELDGFIEDYLMGNARVEPQAFSASQRILKNIIYT